MSEPTCKICGLSQFNKLNAAHDHENLRHDLQCMFCQSIYACHKWGIMLIYQGEAPIGAPPPGHPPRICECGKTIEYIDEPGIRFHWQHAISGSLYCEYDDRRRLAVATPVRERKPGIMAEALDLDVTENRVEREL